MTDHTTLETDLLAQIAGADDLATLDAIRVGALGKTGAISLLLKSLGSMSPDERRANGPGLNALRDRVAAALADRKVTLEAAELDARLAAGRLDLSLPAPPAGGAPCTGRTSRCGRSSPTCRRSPRGGWGP